LVERIVEIEAVFFVVPFHRHRVALAEPASQIDAPATLAAKRKRA
jgi:hypothetical protein